MTVVVSRFPFCLANLTEAYGTLFTDNRVGDRVLIPRHELLRFIEVTESTDNTR